MKKRLKRFVWIIALSTMILSGGIVGLIAGSLLLNNNSIVMTVSLIATIIGAIGVILFLIKSYPLMTMDSLEKTIHRSYIKSSKWLKENKVLKNQRVRRLFAPKKVIFNDDGLYLENEQRTILYKEIKSVGFKFVINGANIICAICFNGYEQDEANGIYAIGLNAKSLYLVRKYEIPIEKENNIMKNFLTDTSEEDLKNYEKRKTFRASLKKTWPLYVLPFIIVLVFIGLGVLFVLEDMKEAIMIDIVIGLICLYWGTVKLNAYFGYLKVTSEGVLYVKGKETKGIGWMDLESCTVADDKMTFSAEKCQIVYPYSDELQAMVTHYQKLTDQEKLDADDSQS